MRLILSADDMMARALTYMNMPPEKQARRSPASNLEDFKCHYGASPGVLAEMWEDLCTTDIDGAKLSGKQKGETGFCYFLMVHHFLWTYPKNANILASRFGICHKQASGKAFWPWVRKIAALHTAKIGKGMR